MAQLAIRGHATRGEEVIEILEMLGGKNKQGYNGKYQTLWYYINVRSEICVFKHSFDGCNFFTLEEFLEKFPYKVGDKVRDARINDCVGEIINARCDDNEKQIIYVVKWDELPSPLILPYFAIDLQPYKEGILNKSNKAVFDANAQCCDMMNHLIKKETMGEKLEQITLDIPKGYEFFGINDDNQVVLAKNQLQYPKTYKECCEMIGYESDRQSVTGYLAEYIENFQQLLICRDAYWKIAGEQMGLENPWEPDFTNNDEERYGIYTLANKVERDFCGVGDVNMILSFPTEEMRDEFYNNFKELIEECKELL